MNLLDYYTGQQRFWPMRKNMFVMYFWTLNSNMFPEFLYHPHLLRCIRLSDRTRLHMSHWGLVGGSLDMK